MGRTGRQAVRQADTHTLAMTDRQKDRQKDRQTDRHTHRHRESGDKVGVGGT